MITRQDQILQKLHENEIHMKYLVENQNLRMQIQTLELQKEIMNHSCSSIHRVIHPQYAGIHYLQPQRIIFNQPQQPFPTYPNYQYAQPIPCPPRFPQHIPTPSQGPYNTVNLSHRGHQDQGVAVNPDRLQHVQRTRAHGNTRPSTQNVGPNAQKQMTTVTHVQEETAGKAEESRSDYTQIEPRQEDIDNITKSPPSQYTCRQDTPQPENCQKLQPSHITMTPQEASRRDTPEDQFSCNAKSSSHHTNKEVTKTNQQNNHQIETNPQPMTNKKGNPSSINIPSSFLVVGRASEKQDTAKGTPPPHQH